MWIIDAAAVKASTDSDIQVINLLTFSLIRGVPVELFNYSGILFDILRTISSFIPCNWTDSYCGSWYVETICQRQKKDVNF